jgi:hypothetical protein
LKKTKSVFQTLKKHFEKMFQSSNTNFKAALPLFFCRFFAFGEGAVLLFFCKKTSLFLPKRRKIIW